MKIRDLQDFRLQYAAYKSGIDSPYPESEVLDNRFYLFRYLGVVGQEIPQYLDSITNFATGQHHQVFYELLQNASDEQADTLYIYYDDEQLLVINNGKKFSDEDLWGFLSRGASSKYADASKKGRFGQGSKLLYTLLADIDGKKLSEKIKNALVEQNESLILFSWDNYTQFDQFRDFADDFNPDLSPGSPILAKFVYTFLPVVPNEEKVIDGELVNLFPDAEVRGLQAFLRKVSQEDNGDYQSLNYANLPQGSLLYLKLGKQVANKFKRLESQLDRGLSVSMHLFDEVQQIIVNQKRIAPAEQTTKTYASSLGNNPNGACAFTYPQQLDYKIADNKEINIYNFSPLINTCYGLKIQLHHSEFTVTSDRQRIDWETYNSALLDEIRQHLLRDLDRLKTNRNAYLHAYTSLVFSNFDLDNVPQAILDFKQEIYKYLEQHIPTQNKYADAKSVFEKKTNLPIQLEKILLKKYWIEIPNEALRNRVVGLFEIPTKNIVDLLLEGDLGMLNAWISGLNERDYQIFINELEYHYPRRGKRLADLENRLKQFKWLKSSSGNLYSYAEHLDIHTPFIILDSRLEAIHPLIKKHQKLSCNQYNLAKHRSLNNALKSLMDDSLLYEKLSKFIEPAQLDKRDKWLLIQKLEKIASADQIKHLAYFKNRKGEFRSLGQLAAPEVTTEYSHVPEQFLIAEHESDANTLGTYMVQKSVVFETLIKDNWDAWLPQPKPTVNVVRQFYEFLKSCTNVSLDEQWDYIYTANNQFVRKNEVINIEYTSEEAGHVQDIFAQLGNYQPIHQGLSRYYNDQNGLLYVGQNLYQVLPNELELGLQESQYLLQLLQENAVAIFDRFYIQETEKDQFLFKKREGGKDIQQIWVEEPKLLQFLEQNQDLFLQLPVSFHEFVQEYRLPILKEGKQSLAQLLQHYGFKKAFAWVVEKYPEYIGKYVQSIPIQLRLADDLNVVFESDDFEYQFATVFARYVHDLPRGNEQQLDILRSRIWIGGQALTELQFLDAVELKNNRLDNGLNANYTYSLSTLIPSFQGKSAILTKAREAFGTLSPRVANLFLGAKKMEADQVYRNLFQVIQDPNFERFNLDQLSFVLVYTKLYEELNVQPLPRPLLEDSASQDLEQTIERFYKDGITYFTFGSFRPKHKVLPKVEWQTFLLERESLNPLIVQWANEGTAVQQSAKASFLAKCGVTIDFGQTKAFQWRNILVNWLAEQVAELELIEEGYWRVNTLEWMANSKKGFPNNAVFLESLETLIQASKTAQDSFANWSIVYAKAEQLRLIALSKQQQYSYFEEPILDSVYWEKVFNICDHLGRRVLHQKFIPDAETIAEQNYNIKLLSIQKQVNTVALEGLTEGAEWQAEQYTETWKQNHNLAIYILPKAVPCQFYLYVNDEQLTMIEEVDAEDWYTLNNQIFMSTDFVKNAGGKVEKALRKLLNSSVLEVDALLDLYEGQVQTDPVPSEHEEILNALLEQGLTVEDLKQLF